ncbi:MAG TPA: response regulator [Terrimicrobiaceae bacterium]
MTLGGQEIIVVDDDMSMSQAIERLLVAAGWRVRSFASAEELLASGASADAAVLIFDIQLPGMSGLELQRHLAAGGTVTPVIFITAQDRPNTRDRARQSGAAAYFTKPFAGRELIQAIRQHLPAA